MSLISRSPHGERGLKYSTYVVSIRDHLSLPARGAWIEMAIAMTERLRTRRRSPHGERGLKYKMGILATFSAASLPARGAWIELLQPVRASLLDAGAPRTGSVD